jgi:hypothetical protein
MEAAASMAKEEKEDEESSGSLKLPPHVIISRTFSKGKHSLFGAWQSRKGS